MQRNLKWKFQYYKDVIFFSVHCSDKLSPGVTIKINLTELVSQLLWSSWNWNFVNARNVWNIATRNSFNFKILLKSVVKLPCYIITTSHSFQINVFYTVSNLVETRVGSIRRAKCLVGFEPETFRIHLNTFTHEATVG